MFENGKYFFVDANTTSFDIYPLSNVSVTDYVGSTYGSTYTYTYGSAELHAILKDHKQTYYRNNPIAPLPYTPIVPNNPIYPYLPGTPHDETIKWSTSCGNIYKVYIPSNTKSYEIKKVIFNDPATIVLWEDGTKTVVKCQDGDVYSKEVGLAMCLVKKFMGNKGNFNEVFKKYCEGDEDE